MQSLSRLVPIILISSLIVLPLSGRGIEDSAPAETSAQRIVQAGSAAFIVQNALALFREADEQLVAIADGNQGNGSFLADLLPSAAGRMVLSRNANTEAILALKPDVVVMKNFLKGSMGGPLEQVGADTFYLDLETPEAWMTDIGRIGNLFDNPERAEELKRLITERLAAVEDPLKNLASDEKPKTLFLYWSVKDGVTAVNVPPMDWMQTRMVEIAGGDPVWKNADLSDRWTKVNIEQIALWNPEQIVVAAYHVPTATAVDAIMSDPLWAQLTAVRSGNVHAFPADYHSWDQPDARWLLGVSWLAGELHPEIFTELNMEAESRQFYEDFFFMDENAYNRMVAPRLTAED